MYNPRTEDYSKSIQKDAAIWKQRHNLLQEDSLVTPCDARDRRPRLLDGGGTANPPGLGEREDDRHKNYGKFYTCNMAARKRARRQAAPQ